MEGPHSRPHLKDPHPSLGFASLAAPDCGRAFQARLVWGSLISPTGTAIAALLIPAPPPQKWLGEVEAQPFGHNLQAPAREITLFSALRPKIRSQTLIQAQPSDPPTSSFTSHPGPVIGAVWPTTLSKTKNRRCGSCRAPVEFRQPLRVSHRLHRHRRYWPAAAATPCNQQLGDPPKPRGPAAMAPELPIVADRA